MSDGVDDTPPVGPGGEGGSRSRTELSDELARAALTPLSEGERPKPGDTRLRRWPIRGCERSECRPNRSPVRPAALMVAVAVAGLLAVGTAVGVLTIHDLRRHGGSVPGGAFLAAVLAALAWGMYRGRYWAVLGFEGLLAFQILVTSLALVVASTVLAAALCLLSIGLGGWLFWKLVRVMGRMQAGERRTDGLR